MTSKLLHPIEIIPKEGCFWTFTLIFPQTFVSKHGQDALLDTFDVIMRERTDWLIPSAVLLFEQQMNL